MTQEYAFGDRVWIFDPMQLVHDTVPTPAALVEALVLGTCMLAEKDSNILASPSLACVRLAYLDERGVGRATTLACGGTFPTRQAASVWAQEQLDHKQAVLDAQRIAWARLPAASIRPEDLDL